MLKKLFQFRQILTLKEAPNTSSRSDQSCKAILSRWSKRLPRVRGRPSCKIPPSRLVWNGEIHFRHLNLATRCIPLSTYSCFSLSLLLLYSFHPVFSLSFSENKYKKGKKIYKKIEYINTMFVQLSVSKLISVLKTYKHLCRWGHLGGNTPSFKEKKLSITYL